MGNMKKLGIDGAGKVISVETDLPDITPRKVLVRTQYAGISAGTETGRIRRRRQNPSERKGEVDSGGFGYSNAGMVEQAGSEVDHVEQGMEVACYGGPYVQHAEYNAVPRNLVYPLPEGVLLKEACFVGIGAIGLHAMRRGQFQLGEKVLVVGLGILGNMTAQALRASGVDVLASEPIGFRREKAAAVGIRAVDPQNTDLAEAVDRWTAGQGLDGAVVLVPSGSADLTNDVLRMCHEKARVVIVGGSATGYDRNLAFQKELDVLIPRAGGPGRYNRWYEEEGNDPPIGYVRWTEGRNMQAWLWMLAEGMLKVGPLITHEFAFDEANKAFDALIDSPHEALGVVLNVR